jgi:hypothetical protein
MLNRRVVRRKALLAPHALLRMQDWTHAWRHRQLSNFEYLMLLNTASGARHRLSEGGPYRALAICESHTAIIKPCTIHNLRPVARENSQGGRTAICRSTRCSRGC